MIVVAIKYLFLDKPKPAPQKRAGGVERIS
jgi:hypothetical protein